MELNIDEEDAIKLGEIIRFLLLQGADANTTDGVGNTLLHVAAGAGDVAAAKFLVSKGANVNAKRRNGFTPLHDAVNARDVAMVRFLVSKKADVNANATEGRGGIPLTPLTLVHANNYARDMDANSKAILKILEDAVAKLDLMPSSNAPRTPQGQRGQVLSAPRR